MQKEKSSSTNVKLRLGCYLAFPVLLYAVPLKAITRGGSTICLFHNIFGRDCYGCGMTRALFSLLHADIGAAWGYNRMVVIVAPLLLYLYLNEVAKTIGELRRHIS